MQIHTFTQHLHHSLCYIFFFHCSIYVYTSVVAEVAVVGVTTSISLVSPLPLLGVDSAYSAASSMLKSPIYKDVVLTESFDPRRETGPRSLYVGKLLLLPVLL